MIALLAAVLVVLAACQGQGAPPGRGEGLDEPVELLRAENTSFKPKAIESVVGEERTFEIENRDEVTHNFTSEDFDIDTDIPAGETVEVRFTPDEIGTFPFFCKYHDVPEMKGRINVD